jgi:hypothetical protein
MPFILALLAKDWKYLAVIAALAVAVGVIYHRGEVHIEAADAKVVAAQIVHNTEVQNAVKAKVDVAVAEYDTLAPIPVPVRAPVLVCHASGSGDVPPSPSPSGRSDAAGEAVPVSAAPTDAGFDPAPAVSATGTAADEEIAHLQAKVLLLQNVIRAYQDGGLVAK